MLIYEVLWFPPKIPWIVYISLNKLDTVKTALFEKKDIFLKLNHSISIWVMA